jgi:nitrogen fixation NifU-like protein
MTDLDLYKETILEEAAHPANKGMLANFDCTYRYGNASCGDMFTVYIKLDESKKTIQEMSWKGEGCAISTAAMSQVSQQLVGKTIQTAEQLTYQEVGKWLGLDQVSPGRITCISVGLKAVQKAVEKS